MNNMVIGNYNIAIKEYNGQRVVTLKDVDMAHERVSGTAGRNFRENKERFIEGEDYFKVCVDEIRRNKILDISAKSHQDIVLLTESGYLMLVKSFKDDLAWEVQRKLVNSYFKTKTDKPMTLPEQIQLIAQGYSQLQTQVQEQEEKITELIECNSNREKELQETKKEIENVQEQINIIGAYQNSYKYKELKTAISSRVMTLLSEPLSRTLWSPFFYKAIHGMLQKHFKAANAKLIPVNQLEEAKCLVYTWKPSKIYIDEKLNELIKAKENNTLSDKRIAALYYWLSITDNGDKYIF